MSEISALMHIIFKISEEIQSSILMMLQDASFGTFLTRLSQLKMLAASLECSAKIVMGGWSKDIILRNIRRKKVFR